MKKRRTEAIYKYCLFFCLEDPWPSAKLGVRHVVVGMALWSTEKQWFGIKFIDETMIKREMIPDQMYPLISLVDEKIKDFFVRGLPYARGNLQPDVEPYHDAWWLHLKEVLVHHIVLDGISKPYLPEKLASKEPEEILNELFEHYAIECVSMRSKSMSNESTQADEFLNDLYRLIEEEGIWPAGEKLFFKMDDFCHAGKFELIDEIIAKVDLDKCKGVWRSLLTVSYWCKDKLKNREDLYERVYNKFLEDRGELMTKRIIGVFK